MFDLAWSEIGVIGLVAVLVLGPKELPQAMRTMAKVLRKMRSLTSELQGHMNEIVREAELDEVRQSIQKLSSANLKSEMAKVVDPTGEMGSILNAPRIEGPPPSSAPAEPAAIAAVEGSPEAPAESAAQVTAEAGAQAEHPPAPAPAPSSPASPT